MQDQPMIRCIEAACGRALPLPVNFCPYCGAAQRAGLQRLDAQHPMPAAAHAIDPGGPGASEAAPAPPVISPVTGPVTPPAVATQADAQTDAAVAASAALAAAAAGARPVAGAARAQPASPPPPPPRAKPAAPAQRQPVRLRWWLLALALLWALWLFARPSTRRIEAQMDKAIALADACKPREAQSALIALRKTKATPEQLQRVQAALNEASSACTRKRQRDKAWREAKEAVDAALAASSVDRARQRLRAFTKRWGEDDASRALKKAIDERQPEHRRADEVEGKR